MPQRKTPAERRAARQEVKEERQRKEIERIKPARALNAGQRDYMKSLRTNALTVAIGPAGTGKTWIAASHAADLILAGKAERVYLCRAAVEATEERLGYLPGDITRKVGPFLTEVVKVMSAKLGAERVKEMLRQGQIEMVPFAYMRGRSLDGVVLLDEAQNTTPAQMRLFLTRLGDATVSVNGDLQQTDIVGENGLQMLLRVLAQHGIPSSEVISFGTEDVVRGAATGLCKAFVAAFDAEDRRKTQFG